MSELTRRAAITLGFSAAVARLLPISAPTPEQYAAAWDRLARALWASQGRGLDLFVWCNIPGATRDIWEGTAPPSDWTKERKLIADLIATGEFWPLSL